MTPLRSLSSLLITSAIALAIASPVLAAERVRVIDGDTLAIGERRVRLEGIDAPEMAQTCPAANGKRIACGRLARSVLKRLAGPNTECRQSGRDRYGREIGYCTSGGVDLNREMVRRGWARAFVKYNDIYAGDEAKARVDRRGLWSGDFTPPWDWRDAKVAENAPKGECVIKGNISRGTKTYYMPFHLMYRQVKISPEKGERFFCNEDEAMVAGWTRALR